MSPTGAGNASLSHSRKSSITLSGSGGPARNTPTSFFFRTEDEIEQSDSTSDAPPNNTFGVESLEESVCSSDNIDNEAKVDMAKDKAAVDDRPSGRNASIDTVTSKEAEDASSSHSRNHSPSHAPASLPSLIDLSQPLTPVFAHSPVNTSAPASTTKSSSLRSFQLYDEDSNADDTGSQAIASSAEDEDETELRGEAVDAPQFVMPSIAMPSRRPFTDNGKHMGKLKIVVTGDIGIGKTSLIKSILQLCEDIVHVDSLSGSVPAISNPQGQSSRIERHREPLTSRAHTTEILASTRAYPDWWVDVEESRILRRRKSGSETVLERNICFIETPAVLHKQQNGEKPSPVLQLVESLLHRNMSFGAMSDSEVLGILSGNGGVQVDLVIYMLSTDPITTPFDLARIRSLAQLTNVIPVIAKGDLISEDAIESTKAEILKKMRQSQIQPFMLGKSISEDSLPASQLSAPFIVSSASSTDDENMDASLLMSPDYIQPLVASDLSHLVGRIFNPDTASWLRHSAAKKCLQWYRASYANSSSRTNASSFQFSHISSISPAAPVLHHPATSPSHRTFSSQSSHILAPYPPHSSPAAASTTSGPSPYSLARIHDHTNREERLAQVRLAKWASDLQRSMQNERDRFEALQKADRAVWLTERLGECVRDGSIVPVRTADAGSASHWAAAARRRVPAVPGKWTSAGSMAIDPRDPLGLLDLNERFARRGLVLVKVLGGCGLFGALAVWVVRSCGWWDGDLAALWSGTWLFGGAGPTGD